MAIIKTIAQRESSVKQRKQCSLDHTVSQLFMAAYIQQSKTSKTIQGPLI